jgi:hypothetical protein
MRDIVLAFDRPEELAYALGKDKPEAARIAKLGPAAAAIALGKMIAKLDPAETTVTPKPAAVTAAPNPPKTVAGSSSADTGKEPDPKDFGAWAKWADRRDRLAAA